jgi:RNA polymerase primary sigma factor
MDEKGAEAQEDFTAGKSSLTEEGRNAVLACLHEMAAICLALRESRRRALKRGRWSDDYAAECLSAMVNIRDAHKSFRKVLEEDAKTELLESAMQGYTEAKMTVLSMYGGVIAWVARRYFPERDDQQEDLIQEGLIGLTEATERFDWKKHRNFTAYAVRVIKGRMSRAFKAQARTVRMPESMWKRHREMGRAAAELRRELGRRPTDEEIAARIGESPERVRELQRAFQPDVSLDDLDDERDAAFVAPMPKPPMFSLSPEMIEKILTEEMSEREEKILRHRFGIGGGFSQTLEEVGAIFNVTRERVRQIETEALKKLRDPSRRKDLIEFME